MQQISSVNNATIKKLADTPPAIMRPIFLFFFIFFGTVKS